MSDDLLPPGELERQKERRALFRGILVECLLFGLMIAGFAKCVSEL